MPWTLSTEVETVLRAAAEASLPRAVCAGAALRQAICDRSARYTTARERMGAPLPAQARAADLAAHALFFAVADAAKIMVPLAELHGRGLLPTAGTLRVLDVGAGPGAMTLGTLDFLHRVGSRAAVSVHAVDRDGDALDILRRAVSDLAARWHMQVSVTTASADLTRTPPAAEGYDLVLAGSVLNEIEPEGRQALLAAMIDATANATGEQGSVIVIEPALRETARDLHLLRDQVMAEGRAHVFAPCVRRETPCPTLEDEGDWCHEDRPVVLPERTAQMSVATGLRSHGLKFAYLTLRRSPDAQVAALPPGSCALRVVSQLRSSKGKHECYVCGDQGRLLVRLLRRNRNPANRDFERVRRGDVLIAPAARAAGGDVAREERIMLMRADADADAEEGGDRR